MSFPIANYLTVARIFMIPLVVILFYAPYPWASGAAGSVFILAAVTDWLDGYLARRLGQTSALGAFLDPVADKLMVAVALVLFVSQEPPELDFQFNPHILITLRPRLSSGARSRFRRCANGWRRSARAAKWPSRGWQAQDHPADDRPVDDAVRRRLVIPAFELGYCRCAAALTLWSMWSICAPPGRTDAIAERRRQFTNPG